MTLDESHRHNHFSCDNLNLRISKFIILEKSGKLGIFLFLCGHRVYIILQSRDLLSEVLLFAAYVPILCSAIVVSR